MFVVFEMIKDKSDALHEKSVKKQSEKAQNGNTNARTVILLRNETQRTEMGKSRLKNKVPFSAFIEQK